MTDDQRILLWQIAMGMVEVTSDEKFRLVTGENISRECMDALEDLSDESFVWLFPLMNDHARKIYLTNVGKKLL